jgi:hypothetical protein
MYSFSIVLKNVCGFMQNAAILHDCLTLMATATSEEIAGPKTKASP